MKGFARLPFEVVGSPGQQWKGIKGVRGVQRLGILGAAFRADGGWYESAEQGVAMIQLGAVQLPEIET